MNEIPVEITERILKTANELFATGDRESFPTVDQVRRKARVDMNAASTVMREWRRQQTSQAGEMAITVPEKVQAAFQTAIGAAWTEAQEVANESLSAAQSEWEEERREAEQLRSEMSQAFEAQAEELEAARDTLKKTDAWVKALEDKNNKLSERVEELQKDLAGINTKKEILDQRYADAEKRIDELKSETAELKGENKRLVEKLSQELDGYRKAARKRAPKKQASKPKAG